MEDRKYDFTIQRTYHDTPNGQLHCLISRVSTASREDKTPSSSPPVLLLHKSASSSKSWLALMQRLSALGFSCFAPDMPGFGESFDPEEDPLGIDWYSGLYHTLFMTMSEFHDGCHVIGHHSGAVVGTDLAARYSSFVKSLTLVGPAIMSAEERQSMASKTMIPFNRPVEDGSHLLKTWDYLIDNGIPRDNVALLQREALDHIRAWRGRMQIYACVWAYDCAAAMKEIDGNCRVAALCARDDVLWPMFESIDSVREGAKRKEIRGGNDEPDLGTADVLRGFLELII